MTIRGHKDLTVWRKAMDLIDMVYEQTRDFPKSELYGLSQQIRRSAVSVASNIAEGSARGSTKEWMQFLAIAKGSLAELDTQLEIASRQGFIAARHETLQERIAEVDKMLHGLTVKLKSKL